MISTLRESENANGESGRNTKTIFKAPLFYGTNKAIKSSRGHRPNLHAENTSRTTRINGNAESEQCSVKEQLGRQPWSELQLARELQAEMLPATARGRLGSGSKVLGSPNGRR